MTTPTLRDLEQLSAYLDGQLPQAEQARLDTRLATDPDLRAALDELRQTRTLLRRTPYRRAPRNFTLTPKMTGIRPPVPRLVPALGWASAVALFLFVCTQTTNLVGTIGLGPMAAAPKSMAPAYNGGVGGGPAENAQPTTNAAIGVTPTPEAQILLAPQAANPAATSSADLRTLEQATPQAPQPAKPVNPWPFIWLGTAVLLGVAAFFVRWLTDLAFHRKNEQEHKPR